MIRTDYYITIMNYIERIIKNSKCVFLESNIYIIIPLEKERYLTDEIQLKLSDFLDCNHCYLILSSVFVTFQELPNIKEIFDFIVKFVDKDKKNIYHFHEYVSIYSMDLLAKKISMDNLFHPLIQKLIDYDQEHKSNYYETFKIFIRNQSSYTITSKDLHMHRNSLKNRINRIEELLGDDYKRPEIREELIFYMRYMDEF
jgi:Regulator of polyketide synthase expression